MPRRQRVGVERERRGDVCVSRHGDDAVASEDGAVGAPAGEGGTDCRRRGECHHGAVVEDAAGRRVGDRAGAVAGSGLVRVYVLSVNVAVTSVLAVMVTTQSLPTTAQLALQPVKVEPVLAVAVRVTTVP